eukprot:TRINITY_DN2194_c0_g3_i1.p1 TRINITY_DN2194_c0_g3~~TRINITY_DN2194_c0_g3_i1.p1  ORF type:complete len:101 (-),score=49.93 TRINITY_DN2194_c0_g3_i1:25-282(-)
MASEEAINQILNEQLQPTYLKLEDESAGCGAKFVITIVSNRFEGLGLLDRHRLVHSVLADQIKVIHALTLKTWTPTQWIQKQSQS